MPPTEKKGRVHTSSVTVAVLGQEGDVDPNLLKRNDDDFTVTWFSGTGGGGQHRNKHQNSCRIIHNPTGISRQAQTRSRQTSYQEAKKAIINELDSQAYDEKKNKEDSIRSEQVGTGMRADKIRTYQFQNDKVSDHITGKTSTCRSVMKGKFDRLWR